jgi:hypothetical protein
MSRMSGAMLLATTSVTRSMPHVRAQNILHLHPPYSPALRPGFPIPKHPLTRAGIQRGLNEVNRGLGKPLRQVDTELRTKYNIPKE